MRKLEKAAGLLAVLLTTIFSVQAAEFYTWVDENGVVNYSERDPQEYDARLVSDRPDAGPRQFGYQRSRTAPEEPAAAEAVEEEPDFGEDGEGLDPEIDAQIAEEKARMEAEVAKVKKSNCAIGKRNLAQLETYARVRVADENGGERVLTDAEKQSRISKARQTIRENCTG